MRDIGLTNPEWRAIIREAISGGSDIHAIRQRPFASPRSVFLELFGGQIIWRWRPTAAKQTNALTDITQLYLADLNDSGVDLEQFGRREKQMWHEDMVSKEFKIWCGDYLSEVTIVGFTYGKTPADFKLWISEVSDQFAGEFWHMIENPCERMPGAWIEEPGSFTFG